MLNLQGLIGSVVKVEGVEYRVVGTGTHKNEPGVLDDDWVWLVDSEGVVVRKRASLFLESLEVCRGPYPYLGSVLASLAAPLMGVVDAVCGEAQGDDDSQTPEKIREALGALATAIRPWLESEDTRSPAG